MSIFIHLFFINHFNLVKVSTVLESWVSWIGATAYCTFINSNLLTLNVQDLCDLTVLTLSEFSAHADRALNRTNEDQL